MLTRILTSIVGLIVFFAVIFAHRFVLYAALGIVTLGMLYEMYEMLDAKRSLKVVGFLSAAAFFAIVLLGNTALAFYAAIAIFMISMVALHRRADCRQVLHTEAVTLFIASSMATLMHIRYEFNKISVDLPFVVAWLTDTGAYFAGSMFGKHKLVPNISPKKTVEGAIGGVVFTVIGFALYCLIWNSLSDYKLSYLSLCIYGFVLSIASQFGDLIASSIKRQYNVKDYGFIFPGHGGVLDRFDGVLLVAPYLYVLNHFIG